MKRRAQPAARLGAMVAALAVAAVAAALAAAPAAAAPPRQPDAEARARAHYEVGLGMYHLGNYADAVREFSAGYELSPRPEFLIDLGQAYRKLGALDKAAEMFRRYLATTGAEAPDRKQVAGLLDEVEREAAARPPAPSPTVPSSGPSTAAAGSSPAPAAAPSSSAPTVAPSTAATGSAAPPAAADLRAAAPRPSGLRRFWWTIPVAAVVVGAAIGLGIYFGSPPSQVPCSSASIGCVDARP